MADVIITKADYQKWLEDERLALRLLNIGVRSWLMEELQQITAKLRATNIVAQEGEIFSYRSVYGSILDDLERIVDVTRDQLDKHYDEIDRYSKKIREFELAEAEEQKKQEIQKQADIAGVKITRLGPSTSESDGAEAERRELEWFTDFDDTQEDNHEADS